MLTEYTRIWLFIKDVRLPTRIFITITIYTLIISIHIIKFSIILRASLWALIIISVITSQINAWSAFLSIDLMIHVIYFCTIICAETRTIIFFFVITGRTFRYTYSGLVIKSLIITVISWRTNFHTPSCYIWWDPWV